MVATRIQAEASGTWVPLGHRPGTVISPDEDALHHQYTATVILETLFELLGLG